MEASFDRPQRSWTYPALKKEAREIRLVTFNDTTADGTLCGTLSSVSLDTRPSYVALSYVWGTGKPGFRITINGAPFKIRQNLHAFLMVSAMTEYVNIAIFIDAICVNQADIEERNSQVNLMGDIYRNANQVVVWLGSFPRRGSSIRGAVANSERRKLQKDTRYQDYDWRQRYLLSSDDTLYLAFMMLKQPFWNRLWVVQEVMLAQSLTFRYGKQSIDIDLLEILLTKLAYSTSNKEGLDLIVTLPLPDHVRTMGSTLILLSQLFEKLTRPSPVPCYPYVRRYRLYELLIAFSEQDCSDPRDIVFGLLGLADTHIKPNYGVSITELYLHVLVEGLLDIHASCSTTPGWKLSDTQRTFILACTKAFRFSVTHTTMYHISHRVCQDYMLRSYRYGEPFFDSENFQSSWSAAFQLHNGAKRYRSSRLDIYGSCRSFLASLFTAKLPVMRKVVLWTANPRERFVSTRGTMCLMLQVYMQSYLRWTNAKMIAPDGQSRTYAGWIKEVDLVADRVSQGIPPGGRTDMQISDSHRDGRPVERSWPVRLHAVMLAHICDAIAISVEIILTVCIVHACVMLGAWLDDCSTVFTGRLSR